MVNGLENLNAQELTARAVLGNRTGFRAGCRNCVGLGIINRMSVCFGNLNKLRCVAILALIGLVLRRGAGCVSILARCFVSMRNNRDLLSRFCCCTADRAGVFI